MKGSSGLAFLADLQLDVPPHVRSQTGTWQQQIKPSTSQDLHETTASMMTCDIKLH